MDWRIDRFIRVAALRWLEEARRRHPRGEIPYQETVFRVSELGQDIRALSPGSGIWKPKNMGACLSLLSSQRQMYDDGFSEDGYNINYRYRTNGGYDHSDNRSLRLAMERRLPILHFWMIKAGLYWVEVVQVIGEAPNKSGVYLQVLPTLEKLNIVQATGGIADSPVPEMNYRTYQIRTRVHQSEFRMRVMRAYREKCAVCRLKQVLLLDAAHIIPDAQGGRPEVNNGLALCRIHHGAYDQNILGIDADYRIHINQDMLQERDGPMLEHGFKRMDAKTIHSPTKVANRPDRDKLQQRYQEFLSV